MKKLLIDGTTRKISKDKIVVGYLQENKIEKLEFEIPEEYKTYGRKACFKAQDKTFAKIFDDITSDTLTLTRDMTQYDELEMSIAFFKTENEDEIVARTSILKIYIENAVICDDDVKPDDPKIIILDNLITKVTQLDNTITKNEEIREANETTRQEYINNLKAQVDNGDFDGADFNYKWDGTKLGVKNSKETTYQYVELKGQKGDKGEKGDTYTLTEQDKQDISNMTVESSKSAFNQYYNGKLEDFNSNATSKTNDYNTNATNKTTEYNNNAISKVNEFNKDVEVQAKSKITQMLIIKLLNMIYIVKN